MKRNRLRSASALGLIFTFITFLVASAPHRVHHLLENLALPAQEISRPAPLQLASTIAAQPGANAAADHHHHVTHNHDHHHAPAAVHTDQARPVAPEEELANNLPLNASAPKQDDQHRPAALQDCIVQAAAQHSHPTVVPCATVEAPLELSDRAPRQTIALSAASLFSSVSQRAPPAA